MTDKATSPEKKDPKISETSWFPHDNDSAADPKMGALIGDFKAEGYGIFWYITELLHADPEVQLELKGYLFKAIAGRFQTDPDMVERLIMACINEYDLFIRCGNNDEFFTSNRARRNRARKEFIVEKRRNSGSKGGNATAAKRSKGAANATAVLHQSSSSAVAPLKHYAADKIRLEEIIYISSNQISNSNKILQDGTPTHERLLGAFATVYPRAMSRDVTENIAKQIEALNLDCQVSLLQALLLDLESFGPEAEFFNEPVEYILRNGTI